MVDDIDLNIISILQKEGQLTSSALARKLNVGESTVRRRIRRLLDLSVIKEGYHVNPFKIGLKVVVFIALSVALNKLEEIASTLARYDEVRYVALTAGRYNIVVLALFKNSQSLGHFMKGPLGSMVGISACEVLLNIDIKKAGLFLGFFDLAARKSTENTEGCQKR